VTTVYLYDDARARLFEPFASTRPISTLTAGVAPIAERWRHLFGATDVRALAGARHGDFADDRATVACPVAAWDGDVVPAGSVVANARFAPELPAARGTSRARTAACSMWRGHDRLAAVRLRDDLPVARLADGSLTLDELHSDTGSIDHLAGWWLDEVWDFVRLLPEQLARDIRCLLESGDEFARPPAYATVLGEEAVALRRGETADHALATIEPHVVLDATAGPILIDAGAHVRAFTRLVGPCYIGRDAQVVGGDVTGCSIGPACKVRGEMSNTVVLGYSNKGHDGFIGHSYLGRWVNLGAGTITSNLKNTYGTVSLWTPAGVRDTGMQFLGTLFGDHVKTGIGLRLTTGTVLGAGANVYDAMPPKVVAPFSWGGGAPYDAYRFEKFAESAARMMARRHVELTARDRRHLAAAHAHRWMPEADDR
jgi:UDP-N-acetylglucosamine diphosphorylase/glucosamine-1-phosphate N-acetyltransferase